MKEVEEVKEEGRTTGDDDDVLFNFSSAELGSETALSCCWF